VDFLIAPLPTAGNAAGVEGFEAWQQSRAQSGFPERIPGDVLRVYTTRPDTLYGVTFMVVAPEHPLLDRLTVPLQREAIRSYCDAATRKSDLDRTDLAREKSGVFTGSFVVHPLTGRTIPVWVADCPRLHIANDLAPSRSHRVSGEASPPLAANDFRQSAAEIVLEANHRCNQENLFAHLKSDTHALSAPVDTLVSNWASMEMASLAWSLQAWTALSLPTKGRDADARSDERRASADQTPLVSRESVAEVPLTGLSPENGVEGRNLG